MQVRLAAIVAAKVEGIRLRFDYLKLSDTVNLLLDAIKHKWDLKLTNLSQIETKEARVRLDKRHYEWLSQYGLSRGINIASATNLLISEYLAGNTTSIQTPLTKPVNQQPEIQTEVTSIEQIQPIEKPKGQTLMRSLKL
ncbi:hypothetical protein H6G41_29840 [Tolypothrix sp. FACHB-123]|uniref:hypothetical protein n=1 Tax=Tolypothrix sp. FACHB-123 TaxID=2692868 RepID=UPI00168A2DA2|nr:hypothetical protein [Tolypothrix sp. FACHB-123]MBD2358749.1 hypothetical protein [Tolypothrix sp. FACHB-123]